MQVDADYTTFEYLYYYNEKAYLTVYKKLLFLAAGYVRPSEDRKHGG